MPTAHVDTKNVASPTTRKRKRDEDEALASVSRPAPGVSLSESPAPSPAVSKVATNAMHALIGDLNPKALKAVLSGVVDGTSVEEGLFREVKTGAPEQYASKMSAIRVKAARESKATIAEAPYLALNHLITRVENFGWLGDVCPSAPRDAAFMLQTMITSYADLFDAKKTPWGRLEALDIEAGPTSNLDVALKNTLKLWREQIEANADPEARDPLHTCDDLETLIEAIQPVRKALRPFTAVGELGPVDAAAKPGPRPFPLSYAALGDWVGIMREEAEERRNDRIRRWADTVSCGSPEPMDEDKLDEEDDRTHGSATSEHAHVDDESEESVSDASG